MMTNTTLKQRSSKFPRQLRLTRRAAAHRRARQSQITEGFYMRYDELRQQLTGALARARQVDARYVLQALGRAAEALFDLSSMHAAPEAYTKAYARLSNLLGAADAIARRQDDSVASRAEKRTTIPAIRASQAAAYALGWWWSVNVQKHSAEQAAMWLFGANTRALRPYCGGRPYVYAQIRADADSLFGVGRRIRLGAKPIVRGAPLAGSIGRRRGHA